MKFCLYKTNFEIAGVYGKVRNHSVLFIGDRIGREEEITFTILHVEQKHFYRLKKCMRYLYKCF